MADAACAAAGHASFPEGDASLHFSECRLAPRLLRRLGAAVLTYTVLARSGRQISMLTCSCLPGTMHCIEVAPRRALLY